MSRGMDHGWIITFVGVRQSTQQVTRVLRLSDQQPAGGVNVKPGRADEVETNDLLEDRNSVRKAISVKELCELKMAELEAGRILGIFAGSRDTSFRCPARSASRMSPRRT